MYVTSSVATSQGSSTKESESQGYLARRCHNYQVLNVARIESGDTCSGDKEFRVLNSGYGDVRNVACRDFSGFRNKRIRESRVSDKEVS